MPDRIDRRALVRRHNPTFSSWHPSWTLSLGNGDFGLGLDASGLQTWPERHELPRRPALVVGRRPTVPLDLRRPFSADDHPIPLRIQSTWGWFETAGLAAGTVEGTSSPYQTSRGPVLYADGLRAPRGDWHEEATWLYHNPRRLDLGRIGLQFAAPVR
ncbi:MAG TPA: hypothetical protein VL961_11360, partial [Acidimicrobiales bacterium]|nr:hypothetical protein [Acidimicrobiales bacterium]